MTAIKPDKELVPGDLVNTEWGTGLVIGFWRDRVLISPTGRDAPYSTRLGYCEAWPIEGLVRRGWRKKPE
jgi:hypothetical protein